ncbi:hypothetical protein AQUCO_14100002v1 [Aquilegia coerulea]|uniref:Pentacotripeptide-repeat region of PRORP domain-containing protein n=1 Tax=Aquilegia coerulea TaxID=218851 RepID=A0A2G5C0Z9_AQUCA|nr:hypothetical protein AQUCO_14100002v1 [Aquilegia coerulea]
MLKLGFSSNGLKPLLSKQHTLSRVCKVFFHSTSVPKTKRDTLYNRISFSLEPRASVVPILDQWIQEGKTVDYVQLQILIKRLKTFKRYKQALEVSRYMTDRRHNSLSAYDNVVRLELIAKVHGIEQAEEYFNNIAKQLKNVQIYNILLQSYVQSKAVDKAESLIKQMWKLGFGNSVDAYNVMIKLYSMLEQYEKMDILMEEMNEKSICPDKFTYNIRLNAYATTSDISGMEKLLQRMKEDHNVVPNLFSYTIAANGYIKAGLVDKAVEILKELEELVSAKKWKSAYNSLLTLYASVGRKEDLNRIWSHYKTSGIRNNSSYYCMIASLLKVNDLVGAENILKEWETADTAYDFRIPNLLIAAYCKNNLLEKAEMFINKATLKGKKPYASTWEIMASGYIEANQIPKALECIKATVLVKPHRKPCRETLAACLLYLKQQGDAAKTEEFVTSLGLAPHMVTDDCERLLDYFYDNEVEAGKVNEDADNLDDDETDIIAKEAT